MRIEIVSRRDNSDADTAFAVFVDGRRHTPEITDIDPGRGYTLDDLQIHIRESAAFASPAAADVIRSWGEQAEASPYVIDTNPVGAS